ncbi:MAG TPA: GNAT family N-acetyltransferase [Kribbellaceae bacterium]|nr:GNAT family N-acetyltransferase [Kribbellaceae bacterium]
MRGVEVRPLEAGDLDEAGRLLAVRHQKHRKAQPLLSPSYEDPATARAEIERAWQTEGASGAVAEANGRLTGFLLGAPKTSPVWGPNVWVESAGLATEDAETMRDLYAVAAARWADEGRTAHYVLVPAHDTVLLDAWYRLGFGQQHAHGLTVVPKTPPQPPATVTIRRAERRDIDVLAQLEVELPLHQGLSPVFSAGTMPDLEESKAEWENDIDDDEYGSFVAEVYGRVVGSAVGCALEKSSSHTGLNRPDNAGVLGFAAVLPQARGAGAGRALGEAVGWVAQRGFGSYATDWRVTNLLSSRTWPRLGFETTFLRLHRVLGY